MAGDGESSIELRLADDTVKVPVLVKSPEVAVIIVVPAANPLATPAEFIVAMVLLLENQNTMLLMSLLDSSE